MENICLNETEHGPSILLQQQPPASLLFILLLSFLLPCCPSLGSYPPEF